MTVSPTATRALLAAIENASANQAITATRLPAAAGEPVIFADTPSPFLWERLLKGEWGAAE